MPTSHSRYEDERAGHIVNIYECHLPGQSDIREGKWQMIPASRRETVGLIQGRNRGGVEKYFKYRGKTLNRGKSAIRQFAEDNTMFTFRNVVSEVTAGLLGQAMVWAVGNVLQGQGAGPVSGRETWAVGNVGDVGESPELRPWHVADAQMRVPG